MSHRLMDRAGFDVSDFLIEVQMGHIPGARYIRRFGYSTINTANVPNSVQDAMAGLYTYYIDYGAAAGLLDIVSSNPADNGKLVYLEGLDEDGYRLIENVLVGETSINKFSRLCIMRNISAENLLGNVNAYVTSTINSVAYISLIAQASLKAICTIPKGMTGFLHQGISSIGSGKEGFVDFSIRPSGQVFSIAERVSLYQNILETARPFIPLQELTDIEVRFTPVQNNTTISTSFGLVLLENKVFGL